MNSSTTTYSRTITNSPIIMNFPIATGSPNVTSATDPLKRLEVAREDARTMLKIPGEASPGPVNPLPAEVPKRLAVFKKNGQTVFRISPRTSKRLTVSKTDGRIMLRIRRDGSPDPVTRRTIIIGPNGRHVTRILKGASPGPQRPMSTFKRDGRIFIRIGEAALNNLAPAHKEEEIQAIIKREASSDDGMACGSKSESSVSGLADIKQEDGI